MKTRSGKKVIKVVRVEFNSAGDRVTFPLKGTIILREKPFKTKYQIWKDDGSASVFGPHPNDLQLGD